IHDKYIQRKHQLLINYPIIGRMRFVFEELREPLRQYFAEETFYESRDKIDWVYTAAKDRPNYKSFSVSQPFSGSRFIIKHANTVFNEDEVDDDISVTFGKNRQTPFVCKTPIIRSAMSDGALSPEAVRAFSLGAANSDLAVNIGEGSLTSNHLYTHEPAKSEKYLEIIPPKKRALIAYKIGRLLFNGAVAIRWYRALSLKKYSTRNTYIFSKKSHMLFRINWKAPLTHFPKQTPKDIPDMIFQMSSGLYGVRDEKGDFDPVRYQKVMRFCKMTEIKIAQGAKQTGGKLAASKVNADIAYYRGVKEGQDLFSPNRFPYGGSTQELLDFVAYLQELSGKPVGFKIVISDTRSVEDMVSVLASRHKQRLTLPDFISIDSGEGGSATAPLELMESVGLKTNNSIYILDTLLEKYEIRDQIKIIASGKILTPDDVVISLSMGADAVGIARGFMMSGGCIRARMCSGFGSHQCPVGMATQDEKKRASYLVLKNAAEIANYHRNLNRGIKMILAIMGIKSINDLKKANLTFKSVTGEIYFDLDKYFHKKLHI
ncbi:MAG: glutamate synthase-related protein, partial [Campylobacterota bacterium]